MQSSCHARRGGARRKEKLAGWLLRGWASHRREDFRIVTFSRNGSSGLRQIGACVDFAFAASG